MMTIVEIGKAVLISIVAGGIFCLFAIWVGWLVQIHEWMSWPTKKEDRNDGDE